MIENSMCNDITTDGFDIEQESLIEIDYRKKEEKYHSIFTIGNIRIKNTKKINWFNRLMFKMLFGIKIEKIKEKK